MAKNGLSTHSPAQIYVRHNPFSETREDKSKASEARGNGTTQALVTRAKTKPSRSTEQNIAPERRRSSNTLDRKEDGRCWTGAIERRKG